VYPAGGLRMLIVTFGMTNILSGKRVSADAAMALGAAVGPGRLPVWLMGSLPRLHYPLFLYP